MTLCKPRQLYNKVIPKKRSLFWQSMEKSCHQLFRWLSGSHECRNLKHNKWSPEKNSWKSTLLFPHHTIIILTVFCHFAAQSACGSIPPLLASPLVWNRRQLRHLLTVLFLIAHHCLLLSSSQPKNDERHVLTSLSLNQKKKTIGSLLKKYSLLCVLKSVKRRIPQDVSKYMYVRVTWV